MNSFYSDEELKKIGFAKIGENVKISRNASIYNATQISIGDNVRIDDFCIVSGKISLGNHIHIAAYTGLFAGEVGIEMEDFSGLSSRCTVYAVTDDYSGKALTNPTIPDEYRLVYGKPVVIRRHALIGASSLVLPGVILEEGSVFGAMSLINKSSEPWSMNVGIPSKKVKERSRKVLEIEKEFLQKEGRNE